MPVLWNGSALDHIWSRCCYLDRKIQRRELNFLVWWLCYFFVLVRYYYDNGGIWRSHP